MKIFLNTTIILFLFTTSSFSETVILKSGKVIEGDMIEMTASDITLEIFGVPTKIKLESVHSIDGQAFILPPPLPSKEVLEVESLPKDSLDTKVKTKPQAPLNKQLTDAEKKERVKKLLERPEKQETPPPSDKDDARDAENYFQIGLIHSSMGEEDKALENYKIALELDSGLASRYMDRALNDYYRDKHASARENFRRARELYAVAENIRQTQIINGYLRQIQEAIFSEVDPLAF